MCKGRPARLLPLILLFVAVVTAPGCLARFAATLLNSDIVPARYDGLRERRVAVIAVSNSSSFGPTSASMAIARKVEEQLQANVSKIQVIDQQIVADWMDRNDWNQIDYQDVGEALQADAVLAIDIHSFSLHDGPALYRGRCDLQINVYDVANRGRVVYEDSPPPIVYPIASGQHATETTEDAFRRRYLDYVATRVARRFYAFNATADYGQDAMMLSN